MKFNLFLLFNLTVFISFSQWGDSLLMRKMNNYVEYKKESGKYLYTDVKISGPGSVSFMYRKQYNAYKYNIYSYPFQVVDTIPYYDNGLMISLVAITIEPRFNISESYNYSYFVKVPVELGLSLSVPIGGYGQKGIGTFNTNVGLLFGYAKKLNSSKGNSTWNGYAISIGSQVIYGPILGGNVSYMNGNGFNEYGIAYNYQTRKLKVIPIIQADYYWLDKKKKVRGTSVAFNPYPLHLKLAYTFSSKIKEF